MSKTQNLFCLRLIITTLSTFFQLRGLDKDSSPWKKNTAILLVITGFFVERCCWTPLLCIPFQKAYFLLQNKPLNHTLLAFCADLSALIWADANFSQTGGGSTAGASPKHFIYTWALKDKTAKKHSNRSSCVWISVRVQERVYCTGTVMHPFDELQQAGKNDRWRKGFWVKRGNHGQGKKG